MENAVSSQSGIFYFRELKATGPFPKNLRRNLLTRIEPRFTAIFASLLVIFSASMWMLSHQKIKDESYTEKEILKIQERYAQLVLNQPKPKVEPAEKVQKAKAEKAGAGKKAEVKKEEVKVDRVKESYVQREQRREATKETREQVRNEVRKQVMSAGIFAAITATGGTGGGKDGHKVTDLLSTATAELSDIGAMNISKGTFAAKNAGIDAAELSRRKGERTSNIGIQKQDVGRAAVTQVASAGSVNITSQAPQITGESANIEERSQAAIQRIVTRETQRLKRVYEDWLKRDPQLAGNLTVKFTILSGGTVSNISIVKSTTNNSDFNEAILRYIKRWQFPSVNGGGPVEVVYPFVFEGQA